MGVKAVIAESFERIHRSNLIGMGILPLQFKEGQSRKTWTLTGDEQISLILDESLKPREMLDLTITRKNGEVMMVQVSCRIDTANELEYYRNQGILQYVLRNLDK